MGVTQETKPLSERDDYQVALSQRTDTEAVCKRWPLASIKQKTQLLHYPAYTGELSAVGLYIPWPLLVCVYSNRYCQTQTSCKSHSIPW